MTDKERKTKLRTLRTYGVSEEMMPVPRSTIGEAQRQREREERERAEAAREEKKRIQDEEIAEQMRKEQAARDESVAARARRMTEEAAAARRAHSGATLGGQIGTSISSAFEGFGNMLRGAIGADEATRIISGSITAGHVTPAQIAAGSITADRTAPIQGSATAGESPSAADLDFIRNLHTFSGFLGEPRVSYDNGVRVISDDSGVRARFGNLSQSISAADADSAAGRGMHRGGAIPRDDLREAPAIFQGTVTGRTSSRFSSDATANSIEDALNRALANDNAVADTRTTRISRDRTMQIALAAPNSASQSPSAAIPAMLFEDNLIEAAQPVISTLLRNVRNTEARDVQTRCYSYQQRAGVQYDIRDMTYRMYVEEPYNYVVVNGYGQPADLMRAALEELATITYTQVAAWVQQHRGGESLADALPVTVYGHEHWLAITNSPTGRQSLLVFKYDEVEPMRVITFQDRHSAIGDAILFLRDHHRS